MEHLSANLKRLREGFGLTQQQLADHLGLNRVQLAMYETGARRPSLAHFEKLAELFCVDLADLISGPVEVPSIGAGLKAAGPLSATALAGLASFFRIVRNYQRMQHLLEAA